MIWTEAVALSLMSRFRMDMHLAKSSAFSKNLHKKSAAGSSNCEKFLVKYRDDIALSIISNRMKFARGKHEQIRANLLMEFASVF